ncbi:MAG: hypothetical protein HY720_26605 [Planctomycetes bacterium]|nr:hypothetical protein [Planctomycetota bacterium]
MPLKSTILYGKIVRQTTSVSEEEILRINQLQDSLLSRGRWVPIGQLYIENSLIDAAKHKEILHHHRTTNRSENDKVFAEYVVREKLIERSAVDSVLKRALELAPTAPDNTPWPKSALVEETWLDENVAKSIEEIDRTVVDPLMHMTGYCETLVEDKGNLTQGRLAFQLGYVGRSQMFDALLHHWNHSGTKSLLETLIEISLLNEVEEEQIRTHVQRFLP